MSASQRSRRFAEIAKAYEGRTGDQINAALAFFDCDELRHHYTSLITELRALRDEAWERETVRHSEQED